MFQLLIVALLAAGQSDAKQPTAANQPTAAQPATAGSSAQGQTPKTAEKAAAGADAAAAGSAEGGKEPDAKSGEGTAQAAQEGESAEGDEAQESADSDEGDITFIDKLKEIFSSGAIGLLVQGGFFMWPILLLGIVAAGVIIERYRSLRMLSTDSAALRSQVSDLLSQDRVEEAFELCEGQQGPVPAILSAGLRRFLLLRRLNYDPARIEEQVVKSMDDSSVHVVAALERHLPILATISSVAPMIGFLGTVQGMIVSFKDIVEKMGETNIVESAAAGIQVALLTTCFGLIIGIPAFMAFNYFTSVINRYVLDVEESATGLIEAVTFQMTAMQGAARQAGADVDGSHEEQHVRAAFDQ